MCAFFVWSVFIGNECFAKFSKIEDAIWSMHCIVGYIYFASCDVNQILKTVLVKFNVRLSDIWDEWPESKCSFIFTLVSYHLFELGCYFVTE